MDGPQASEDTTSTVRAKEDLGDQEEKLDLTHDWPKRSFTRQRFFQRKCNEKLQTRQENTGN